MNAVLLALALGCSTRSLVLDLRGEGGGVGGVSSGGHMGRGGAEQRVRKANPAVPDSDDLGPLALGQTALRGHRRHELLGRLGERRGRRQR